MPRDRIFRFEQSMEHPLEEWIRIKFYQKAEIPTPPRLKTVGLLRLRRWTSPGFIDTGSGNYEGTLFFDQLVAARGRTSRSRRSANRSFSISMSYRACRLIQNRSDIPK